MAADNRFRSPNFCILDVYVAILLRRSIQTMHSNYQAWQSLSFHQQIFVPFGFSPLKFTNHYKKALNIHIGDELRQRIKA